MPANSYIPSRKPERSIERFERHRPAKATSKTSNDRDADRPYGLSVLTEQPVAIHSYVDLKKTIAPLRFVINPIVRRGSLYTFTAPTNAGKTTLCLMFALAVATGRSDILDLDVEEGRVAYVSIQNHDDTVWRFVNAQRFYDIPDLRLRDRLFIVKVTATPESVFEALEELSEFGSFALVVVDTFAACFDGADLSDNVAAGNFSRHLRAVTRILGRPAVVVPAHPAKSADKGLLIPYGGGAIIDEVDGNLTLSRAIDVCKLHWQAKLLGPNFEPVLLRFRNYSCDEVRDAKGRRVIMPLLAPYVERP